MFQRLALVSMSVIGVLLSPWLAEGVRPPATARAVEVSERLEMAVRADSFEEAAYEFVEYGVADKETITRLVALLQEAGNSRVAAAEALQFIELLSVFTQDQPPTVKARLEEWLVIFEQVARAVRVGPMDEAQLLEWASLKVKCP